MGGCSFEEEDSCNVPQTLVLVGKTGNGKSATGNSILGMQVFKSKRSTSGVTITSELQSTTLNDGQMINVIDTPGLFDSSLDFEFIGKEIVNCINMAKDGIHAFLVVISIRNRFSEDERAAVRSLLNLFGRKIYDYMIIVFTCGDDLEEDESLEAFLHASPPALKEILDLCEDRCVLFDNRTNDESKKTDQVNKLFSLVQIVSIKNGGKAYTNEFFTEFKNCPRELDQQEEEEQFRDVQFKRMIELVESKLKDTTMKLERQLAEEREARVKAEKKVTAAREKEEKLRCEWEEERRREEAHWQQREEDLRRHAAAGNGCYIL